MTNVDIIIHRDHHRVRHTLNWVLEKLSQCETITSKNFPWATKAEYTGAYKGSVCLVLVERITSRSY